jgi:hypothetical protein
MLTQQSFSEINVDDDELSRVQRNVSTAVNPVLATPIINGVLIENQVIPSTGKLVLAHRMGRVPLGFIVVRASAEVSYPYALAAEQYAPTSVIVLTFSTGAGASVSVWVF